MLRKSSLHRLMVLNGLLQKTTHSNAMSPTSMAKGVYVCVDFSYMI